MKAVLFKSQERFSSFKDMLEHYNVKYVILDFASHEWIEYDYVDIPKEYFGDFLAYLIDWWELVMIPIIKGRHE